MEQFDPAGVNTIISSQPDFPLPVQEVDPQSLLYQYFKKGSINGAPVVDTDKNLGIKSQEQLLQAMQAVPQVKVWTGYLSPQFKKDVQQYQALVQKIQQGSAIKLDQQKQFSSGKDAFLVVITYADIHYELNQRYNFYRTQE